MTDLPTIALAIAFGFQNGWIACRWLHQRRLELLKDELQALRRVRRQIEGD